MNFLPATVTADGGLALGDGTRLPLPPSTGPLAPGRALTVGVRPEHLASGPESGLTVTVELAEQLGADTIVHGRLGDGATLLARLPGPSRVAMGERLRLTVDAEQLHLFDRETGRRV
jgi:sn-glycerol 3-phosphate transport system ATP-binding protein